MTTSFQSAGLPHAACGQTTCRQPVCRQARELGETLSGEHNDYAVQPVPLAARRGLFSLALEVAGFTICLGGMFTGSALAAGMNLRDAIIATVIGNSVLALYAGFVGAIGAKLGVSTTMLCRHAFGRSGSTLIGLVWAVTLVGWYSVQTGFFGQTINAMWPDGGVLTSVAGAALWGGLLMMLTAYWGYEGLSMLSKIAVPALFILMTIGLTKVVGSTDLLSFVPKDHFELSKGITLVVGGFAVGAVIQADVTRYAQSAKHAWIATLLGFVFANTYVIGAGILTAIATGAGDLPKAMLALGLGIPAMLVIICAQWTTNDNNLYSASLAAANAVRVKKSIVVLILGVLATLIGVWGLADRFVPWLMTLGILIPPIAGIIIADFWIAAGRKYAFGVGTAYSKWNLAAFAAWVLGAAAGAWVPFGVAAINSIMVALVSYLAITFVCKRMNLPHAVGRHIEGTDGF